MRIKEIAACRPLRATRHKGCLKLLAGVIDLWPDNQLLKGGLAFPSRMKKFNSHGLSNPVMRLIYSYVEVIDRPAR